MIYDPVNGLIYVSVPSSAGAPYGNSIVSVDPATGALGTPIFVGSEPVRLAIASDGHYLWVGLDGSASVPQADLVAGAAGLQFAVSNYVPNNYYVPAEAIAALPGVILDLRTTPKQVCYLDISKIITIMAVNIRPMDQPTRTRLRGRFFILIRRRPRCLDTTRFRPTASPTTPRSPADGKQLRAGVAVMWNGSYWTTTIVDAAHLSVAIPASDLASAGSATLTAVNPGAGTSNGIVLTIN